MSFEADAYFFSFMWENMFAVLTMFTLGRYSITSFRIKVPLVIRINH